MYKYFIREGLAALLLFLGCAWCAQSGEAAPSTLTPEAERQAAEWIEQLGSPGATQRDAAYQNLARLGRAAMPMLRQATYHRNHDVRWRAGRLLNEVAAGDAWSETARARLKAATVTLSLKDVPLAEALRLFAAQTHLEVILSPHLQRALAAAPLSVRLEVKDYGAEQALERILDDLKLSASLVFNAVVVEGGTYMRPALQEQALGTPVGPFAFKDRPLREALAEVRAASPVGLALDEEVFAKEAAKGYTVNLTTKKPLRLESVLSMLLEGHDLGFVFDDRRLLVTSQENVHDPFRTAEYPLRDLVASLRARKGGQALEELLAAIRESVDRRGWGEPCRMTWRDDEILVVTQRRGTQARVAAFLEAVQKTEGLLNKTVGEDLEF